jgi:hypothetical protein
VKDAKYFALSLHVGDGEHAFVFAGFTRFIRKNIGQEKSPDLREEDSGLVVKVRQCLTR